MGISWALPFLGDPFLPCLLTASSFGIAKPSCRVYSVTCLEGVSKGTQKETQIQPTQLLLKAYTHPNVRRTSAAHLVQYRPCITSRQ